MELGSEVGNAVEQDAQGRLASTIGSQPWWRGPGFDGLSTVVLPQGVSRSHSVELPLRGGGLKSGRPQLHDGGGDACQVSKEMQNMGNRAGSDGSYGQAHQQMQPVSSTMPPMMPEYLAPHAQIGPSVACAAYTYSDPYYAGLMTAYGNQAMVHPQLPGISHTRMPLPLEMAEEPVYVNAKQYHGILRRRQSRAKLEVEKKLIKARKPYLHESRHQHAMKRERGCGGRFINTKKSAANIANYNAACGANSGASLALKPGSSSSTDTLHMDCSGNSDSASVVLEVGRPGLQGMFEPHARAISNDRHQEHSGFQLSTFNTKQSEEGNLLGQQRGGILVNRPPNRVVAIK